MVSLNGFDIAVSHIIAEDQLKPLKRPSRHSIKNKTFPKQKKKKKKKVLSRSERKSRRDTWRNIRGGSHSDVAWSRERKYTL